MANVRYTSASDNITLGSDATFLGQGGDDNYIFDPNLVPDNATIEISDNEGVNTLRLPTGLEIESSIVATLSDGGVAIQLTLTNGTTIFIDRADEFDFQVGGDTGGNGATDQTITEFVEDTLGTTIPAPGGLNDGGAMTIGQSPATAITEAIEYAATPNQEDRFVLKVDNSGGDITNPDYDGTATITNFDPAEDTLVFENVAGSTVTEDDILNENGLDVLENPIPPVSLTYVLAVDPGVPGTDGAIVRIDGISEQNGDFIEIA